VLGRVAELLHAQHANPFRVAAYRRAALSVRELPEPIAQLVAREGEAGLQRLPHVGRSIAGAIRELVQTGHLRALDRLEGHVAPEDAFMKVAGLGEILAHRIVDTLHIETLEELEVAAHDGRLAKVSGFGRRRVQALRDQLATLLSRSTRREAQKRHHTGEHDPSVELLLDVDSRYRSAVRKGTLRKIAPHRFNPKGIAWLPVLHLERDGWSFHVMFSNSARAHRLGRTSDWVVIVYERGGRESQCTVVTEHRGPDAWRRVVRGRERESYEHHLRHPQPPPTFQRAQEPASMAGGGPTAPPVRVQPNYRFQSLCSIRTPVNSRS
jgi:hypothetical protein